MDFLQEGFSWCGSRFVSHFTSLLCSETTRTRPTELFSSPFTFSGPNSLPSQTTCRVCTSVGQLRATGSAGRQAEGPAGQRKETVFSEWQRCSYGNVNGGTALCPCMNTMTAGARVLQEVGHKEERAIGGPRKRKAMQSLMAWHPRQPRRKTTGLIARF